MIRTRTSRRSAPGPRLLSSCVGTTWCEGLEPRQLMSSFVYSDLADLIKPQAPTAFADGYNGPMAVIGDINGDGKADLLASRSGVFWSSKQGTWLSGAAVFSGADGALVRAHDPGLRGFGWSIAALGDVTGDGIPDYGIGTSSLTGGPEVQVFSGKTGKLFRRFSEGDPTAMSTVGAVVAGPGDVNGDRFADVLIGYAGLNKAVVYSGKDGSILYTLDGAAAGAAERFGLNVAGGAGLGTPFLGGANLAGTGTHDFLVVGPDRIVVYTGSTGAIAYTIALSSPIPSDQTLSIGIGRGVVPGGADTIIQTRDNAITLYDGATGHAARTIAGPAVGPFTDTAVAIGDLTGDGVGDLAVGASLYSLGSGSPPGAIYLYSGADGSRLAVLSGESAATADGITTTQLSMGDQITAGDLDGDGRAELVASATYNRIYESAILRLVRFDGSFIYTKPVIEGTTTDAKGNLMAWGHQGSRGFIIRQGRATFLSELEGFGINDRVITLAPARLTIGDEGLLIVFAPGGDATKPKAWYAKSDLTSPSIFSIADTQRFGGPEGTYVFDRVVDADDGRVLVQFTRDGTTPAAYSFFIHGDRIPGLFGSLDYLFDGTATDMDMLRFIGRSASDPTVGLLLTSGTIPLQLPGFSPVAMRLVPGSGDPPVVEVVGLAKRDGDTAPRPYIYNSATKEFTALPLIPGGTDWNPTTISDAGDVTGTYRTADGDLSAFVAYAAVPVFTTPARIVDLSASTIIGGPADWADLDVSTFGSAAGNQGELYVRYTDPATGRAVTARLFDADASGPFHAPADAAFAVSDDGHILVTRNAAGQLLVFTRGADGKWAREDLSYSPVPDIQAPVYATPHFGELITWSIPQFSRPYIALATSAGTILIEPVYKLSGTGGVGRPYPVEMYQVRNLTSEIAGSEAITRSILTFLPHNNLRVVAGLTGGGDLVMYGLTAAPTFDIGAQTSWAYANLFDLTLRPYGITPPVFDTAHTGNLVGYVTAWDGLNIAGVSNGHVVTFWTAPGISGWRFTDLNQVTTGVITTGTELKNLSVYLTSWGGINIVGGNDLQVYWWAPGLGGEWRFDLIGGGGGPALRSETITSYVAPWGGLNIAGLDQSGRLWVFWWTPNSGRWIGETVDSDLSPFDRAIPRTGRLTSTVSDKGEFSIFARSVAGDVLRYAWSPTTPWHVEDLSLS